jgi:hypothetical protein
VGEIFVSGMDCEVGLDSSFFGKAFENIIYCPDDQHCCNDDGHFYCCSSAEFVSKRQVCGLHVQSFHLNL